MEKIINDTYLLSDKIINVSGKVKYLNIVDRMLNLNNKKGKIVDNITIKLLCYGVVALEESVNISGLTGNNPQSTVGNYIKILKREYPKDVTMPLLDFFTVYLKLGGYEINKINELLEKGVCTEVTKELLIMLAVVIEEDRDDVIRETIDDYMVDHEYTTLEEMSSEDVYDHFMYINPFNHKRWIKCLDTLIDSIYKDMVISGYNTYLDVIGGVINFDTKYYKKKIEDEKVLMSLTDDLVLINKIKVLPDHFKELLTDKEIDRANSLINSLLYVSSNSNNTINKELFIIIAYGIVYIEKHNIFTDEVRNLLLLKGSPFMKAFKPLFSTGSIVISMIVLSSYIESLSKDDLNVDYFLSKTDTVGEIIIVALHTAQKPVFKDLLDNYVKEREPIKFALLYSNNVYESLMSRLNDVDENRLKYHYLYAKYFISDVEQVSLELETSNFEGYVNMLDEVYDIKETYYEKMIKKAKEARKDDDE